MRVNDMGCSFLGNLYSFYQEKMQSKLLIGFHNKASAFLGVKMVDDKQFQ
jgi:hypothetical protein